MEPLSRRHYDDRYPEGEFGGPAELVEYRGGDRRVVGQVFHKFSPTDITGSFAYIVGAPGHLYAMQWERGLGGSALPKAVSERLVATARKLKGEA